MPSHLNDKEDSKVEVLSVGLQQSTLNEEQQERSNEEQQQDDSDESNSKKGRKRKSSSIEPQEIANQLEDSSCKQPPLLIDARPLEHFEKSRIKYSINVNLPSLLIKRYQRGVVSNFNLESFITTSQGIEYYNKWLQDTQKKQQQPLYVVYDEHMNQQQQQHDYNNSNSNNSHNSAWTLISVLQKSHFNVAWLRRGYKAFVDWDFAGKHLEGSEFNRSESPPLPMPSCSTENSSIATIMNHTNLKNNINNTTTNNNNAMIKKRKNKKPIHPNTIQLKMPMPMISKSATTLSNVNSNVNVQRRASLFSLDTSLKSKSNKRPPPATSVVTHQRRFDQDSPGDQTPKTEAEYEFVISEVIPGFLFLGPEIVNSDQVLGLKARSIQRILNMAEECDDDVPGLKDTFVYTKVAARDTVEMKNIDETLKKAVHVINDSKKHHAPIYVHCQAGKSRSVAAVLAYLVVSEHWTLKRAYRHVVKVRPNISPNIGFVAELMKMEEAVHGQVSNFAAVDWHLIDFTNPPSPDTQREMGRLERAWKRDRSNSRSSSSGFYFAHDPNKSSGEN
ncbi:hypothetical protein K501DRAFT_285960 [Backusella circina FSU 941]|nr:hypothetical protein K501DRAFT_285960 [Backusella circina FSU 941]